MYMDIGNKRRARGDRDVFFDSKRNLYVGMLSYIDPKTGKRYRPTVYDKSEKQARLKLKALEREHNDSVNSKLDNRITVSGWLEAWFRDFQSGKLPAGNTSLFPATYTHNDHRKHCLPLPPHRRPRG